MSLPPFLWKIINIALQSESNLAKHILIATNIWVSTQKDVINCFSITQMYFQGQPIVIPRFSKMTPILTLILLNKLEVRLSIYLFFVWFTLNILFYFFRKQRTTLNRPYTYNSWGWLRKKQSFHQNAILIARWRQFIFIYKTYFHYH